MSMTVHLAIKGVTDLECLLEAIRAMGGSATAAISTKSSTNAPLALVSIDGRKVKISRNREEELTMVGDNEWSIMRDERFMQRLRQQYGVASVKKKALELGYRIAEVREDTEGNIRVVARAWR